MIDLQAIRKLSDIPRAQARARGDQAALLQDGRTTTFAELEVRSNQVAQALLAQGLQPGERVSVLARNSDRFFALFFGVAKARLPGANQLPPGHAGDRLHPARRGGPLSFFVGDDQFDVAERIAARERDAGSADRADRRARGLGALRGLVFGLSRHRPGARRGR